MKKKVIRLNENDIENLVKRIIKEDDFDWVRIQMDNTPDEPEFLALAECYGGEVLYDIEETGESLHGMTVYVNRDGEKYSVHPEEDMGDVMYEYYEQLYHEVGIEGWNVDVEQFHEISNTDVRMLASDLADSDVDSYTDDDVLRETNNTDEYEKIQEKIYELNDKKDGLEDKIDGVDGDELSEVYEEIDEIDDLISDYESDMSNLIEDSYNEFRDAQYEYHHDQLINDPIEYLTRELGLYSDLSEMEHLFYFDEQAFLEHLSSMRYYGELSNYDGDYCSHEGYICVRIE